MSHLLSPFEWDGIRVANRVAMSPMTRSRAGVEMTANSLMAEYYAQRASAGVIVTEGTFISPQAVGWRQAPGIWSDEQVAGWRLVTEAVHRSDTPIFLQLWHTGRASHSDFHDGELPVAPSPIKLEGDPMPTPSGEKKERETPRPLETDEVAQVVEDYRRAADQAKRAGFDGVEIHAANGYLIDEFLQSKTNHREDRYGGSVANRFRFLREVVEACQSVWPQPRVGVRISPNGEFNDMGSPDFRDTFVYVAEQLAAYDLAWLDVLDGLQFGFHELGEPVTLAELREVYGGRMMGNCGYDQRAAEEAIQAGHADLIAFGRPYISNPDLVERFANGWDFNEEAPREVWYSFDPHGYVDYPTYEQGVTQNTKQTLR